MEAAISQFELVIRCHQERGDRLALAMVYNNLGSLYGDMGNYLRAERFFRETIRIRRAAKHGGLALALTNLGSALYHLERLDESRSALDEALDLRDKGQAPSYMESELLRYHGLLCLRETRLELARDALEQARVAAVNIGGGTQLAETEMAMASLELLFGNVERAENCFRKAIALLDVSVHQVLIGRMLASWSENTRTLAPQEADSYHAWSVALTTRRSR